MPAECIHSRLFPPRLGPALRGNVDAGDPMIRCPVSFLTPAMTVEILFQAPVWFGAVLLPIIESLRSPESRSPFSLLGRKPEPPSSALKFRGVKAKYLGSNVLCLPNP